MKKPSFTDLSAPKHDGVEKLKQLLKPVDFKGVFTATTEVKPAPPRTLLEFYVGNDLRQIYDDMRARPSHYDDRQKALLEHLVGQTPSLEPAPTDREKDDLLIHWMRSTEVDARSRDLTREISAARHRKEKEDAENEEIVMEDGRTLKQHIDGAEGQAEDPSFEKQDFGDKIIV